MDLILTTALTLFIVLDPFGNIVIFHTVLEPYEKKDRARILRRELIIALSVLMFFLFFGEPILSTLGLQSSTLRISGAIILFIIALGMVFPTKSVINVEDEGEPFIVPLAIPMMAGPSTIILVLLLAQQHNQHIEKAATAIFLAWAGSAVVLLLSATIMRFLGQKGTRALERLMGMLLVLISIQMFLDGVAQYQHLLLSS